MVMTRQRLRKMKPIVLLPRGFTLIELMIVVAIVAILATIAYPSYTRYTQKARRAQAKADLTELAQYLERKYTMDRDYRGATPASLGIPQSPRDTAQPAAYTITNPIPNLTKTTYTLTAVPAGVQATDVCGTLTINQAGAKTASGQAASGLPCW